MENRVLLVVASVISLAVVGALINPNVYAYATMAATRVDRVLLEGALLETGCLGFVVPGHTDKYARLYGGNRLCVDSLGRSVYEHVRFAITVPGPGLYVYKRLVYLYANVTLPCVLELVVEKPSYRYPVLILVELEDSIVVALNASRAERHRLYLDPGARVYGVTITVEAREQGREVLRLGVYVQIA